MAAFDAPSTVGRKDRFSTGFKSGLPAGGVGEGKWGIHGMLAGEVTNVCVYCGAHRWW